MFFAQSARMGECGITCAGASLPGHAVTLTQSGDEAIVQAQEASPEVVLTAYSEGDTAEASIEVLAEDSRKTGSVIWSVKEIPGCKDKKIIPAVPSANGPDIYVQEDCPQGTMVRAITADGNELWRRLFGGPGAVPAEISSKGTVEPAQRLKPHSTSVCDSISPGISREEAGRIVSDRSIHLDDKQRSSLQWLLEEEGFRCTISFDAGNGTVVKKKKTVVTD